MISYDTSYVPHDCKWDAHAYELGRALTSGWVEVDYRFECDVCGLRYDVTGRVSYQGTANLAGGAPRSSWRHRRWRKAQRRKVAT